MRRIPNEAKATALRDLDVVAMAQPHMLASIKETELEGGDRNRFWRGAPERPHERIRFLQDRIKRDIADGSLDRRKAPRANGELDRIRAMDWRMHDDSGSRLDDLSRGRRWARDSDRSTLGPAAMAAPSIRLPVSPPIASFRPDDMQGGSRLRRGLWKPISISLLMMCCGGS